MKWIPGRLDKYIIQKFLSTFFFSILVVLSIVGIIDFSEKIDNFLEFKLSFTTIIMDYYIHFFQFYGSLLSPIMVYIAVIFFTSKMANNTEIVPILSGGVSYNRFLYPYLLVAIFLGSLTFYINGYVIPKGNKKRAVFEDTYINRVKDYTTHNYHFQLNDSSYVYLESFDYLSNTGYKFSIENITNKELHYKLMADRIQWDSVKHSWAILDYSIRYVDNLKEKLVTGNKIDTVLDFKPSDFQQKPNTVEAMTLPELDKHIVKEKLRGNANMASLYMERHKRYAMPFTIMILIFMGATLASRKVRGGLGTQLGAGIGISFLYVLLLQFTGVFATKGGMPPFLAAWLPNILFGCYSIYLYRITPK